MSLGKNIGRNIKQELMETKAICAELIKVVYFAGQAIEDIEAGTAKEEDIKEVKAVINQLMLDFGVDTKEVKDVE